MLLWLIGFPALNFCFCATQDISYIHSIHSIDRQVLLKKTARLPLTHFYEKTKLGYSHQ